MRMSRFFFVVVFLLTILIGYGLLPNKNEHITMLLRDKEYGVAHQQLMDLFSKGNRNPYLLMHLYNLHERYGHVEKIEQVLTAYLSLYPNDTDVRAKLVEFYLTSNRRRDYLEQLERLVDIGAKPEDARRLFATTRLYGHKLEELRLLEKYRSHTFFASMDMARLALIYLHDNRQKEALTIFREMDEKDIAGDGLWEARLPMVKLLLQETSYAEVIQRTGRWVRQSHDQKKLRTIVYFMMRQLQARGNSDLIGMLADEIIRNDRNTTFIVVSFLVKGKQYPMARTYLQNWHNEVRDPKPEEITHYVNAAIAVDGLQAAINIISELGLAKIPEQSLIAIGEELAHQKQFALLKTISPFFSPEGLAERPLFAAKLYFLQGRRELTAHFFDQIDPVDLEPEESEHWFEIYKDLYGLEVAFGRLQRLRQQKPLSRNMLRIYAATALKLGHKEEHMQIWAELGGYFPFNDNNQL